MTEYPQYRKYVGVETWFKIISENEFIEIKRIGDRYVKIEVSSSQFPELNMIQDMLKCHEGRWERIEEGDFNKMLSNL